MSINDAGQKMCDTYNLPEKIVELTGMSMESAIELINAVNGDNVRNLCC